WVVFAFVGYELVVATFGLDLGAALTVWTPLVPAMAIVIGLIPGCGPQILVTSLYVSGAVPLSAQLGNAVANDGDALFPAIAVAPKAALLATVYSAVPAFLVAYGWYFLFE
ncbi:MAG TPA: putative manganese transporter, partial [Gammaproteobacteria bacterium]|nr:putative manganese transporter [Gammaproteobacteria bacterium]